MTQARLNYHALASAPAQALSSLSASAGKMLEPRLRELVNLRVSQINGCAFCIDMHGADLMRQGVAARDVIAVAGWREAHQFFSDRERAALNWAEAVNAIPQRLPTDADYEELQRHFQPDEIAGLTFVIGAIRAWNMLNVSMRTPVPPQPHRAGH